MRSAPTTTSPTCSKPSPAWLEDWQQLKPYQQNTPVNDVARALSTFSILAGNVLAELATIREHIAWAKETGR